MMHAFQLPAWALMWLLALAIYGCAKCATIAIADLRGAPFGRMIAYLLLFPGMNATTFCALKRATPPSLPGIRHAANVLAGAALLWGVARWVPPHHPILQGWLGMIGLILLLHFGLLQLIARAWQAAGLVDMLASEFGAPVDVFDPFRRVTTPSRGIGADTVGPAYAVAVGLAMRQEGDR
jgi:hypothetical protein